MSDLKPIIYQLFPRTFTNYNPTRKKDGSREENGCGTFNGITLKALKAIRDLGATHVWFTGVIRHATAAYNNPSITKGKAGSPYAITDYYDVDPDLAENVEKRMAEFEGLVERTHKQGLKVIIDFVPNHVSREYKSVCKPKGVKDLGQTDHPEWAFSPLNNFYYLPGEKFEPQFAIADYEEFPAKVTGNDCFTAHPGRNDWYETVKLNYGVHYMGGCEKQFDPIPDTWNKMLGILRFWAGKGVDAFRVDMAEMVPVEFWKWVIAKMHKYFPQVQFIAECYNPDLYRAYLNAGFDYLYDKVGMYDYLRGVTSKNWPVEGITMQWQRVEDIRDKMLYFLENHDEQRLASGFFCGRGICAEPAMIVAATLGINPVMIYAGQELGETGMDLEGFSGMDGRSSIFDYWGLKSLQAWTNNGKFDGKMLNEEQKDLRRFYQKLLTVARDKKAITSGLMYDLEYAQGEGFNKHEQYAFLRKYEDQVLLMIMNFDDRQVDVDVRIPKEAFDYLKQAEWESASAVDLLTDTAYKSMPLTSQQPVHLTLPAWKGVILEFKKTTPKKGK
ncbi:MAG: alpha-glucosidase C-terminal domain-containing protein [Bacteroidales bacterium]|nr:alpha-glucosidase C-terminal domain-containing protein [Bacteroidales bacterium]